jgi:hypothetical protein
VDDLSSCCLRWMRKLEGSSPNLVSPRVYGTLRFRQRGSAAHTGPYAVLGSFVFESRRARQRWWQPLWYTCEQSSLAGGGEHFQG